MRKIFLSYSSQNREHVMNGLVKDLEGQDYEVWIDHKKLGVGSWWENILEAIREAELIIFALSPDWLESKACQKEFDYATALNKNRLPVHVIDVGNLRTLYQSLQSLDILDYRTGDKDQFSKLVKKLKGLPESPPLPNPLPEAPDEPIAEIASLAEFLREDQLTAQEQQDLFNQLLTLREDPNQASDVNLLLGQMRNRVDLDANLAQQIDTVLGSPQTAGQPAQKSSRVVQHSFTNRARISLPNARRLRHIATFETSYSSEFAFSPDSKFLAFSAAEDAQATIWDLNKQQLVAKFEYKQKGFFDMNTGKSTCVAFSPDGKYLATAGYDGKIWLWNLSTKDIGATFKPGDSARKLIFSPDGRWLVAQLLGKTIKVWDMTTAEQYATFKHRDNIQAMALSANGTLIASTTIGGDKIHLWDILTKREQSPLPAAEYGYGPREVTFSPDGAILAHPAMNGVRLWEMASRHELGSYTGMGYAKALSFSPDGTMLAVVATSSDHDKAGYKEVDPIEVQFPSLKQFNPNKKSENILKLIQRDNGQILCNVVIAHDKSTLAEETVFSPDSTLLAVSFLNNELQLFGIV